MMNVVRHRFTTLRKFSKTDIGIGIVVALIWQTAMTILGFSLAANSTSLLAHTFGWDSGWYSNIVNNWYDSGDASPAFYPLFPLVVRSIMYVLGTESEVLAAHVINLVALSLATAALIKISRHFLGSIRYQWLPVVFFLASPAAFFLHLFYSETFFCAIVFWAYWFALKHRWLPMSLLLGLAMTTRIPSLLFIGLCGLEYLRTYNWSLRKAFNPKILWILIVPIGFIAYALYLFYIRHNALAMFHAYSLPDGWPYHQFNPNVIETAARALYRSTHSLLGFSPFTNSTLVNSLLPCIALITLAATSVYALLKYKSQGKFMPLAVFGVVSGVFFTLNNNVFSVHRYILPCISIYIILAYVVHTHRPTRLLVLPCVLVSLFLQIYTYRLFILGHFAG